MSAILFPKIEITFAENTSKETVGATIRGAIDYSRVCFFGAFSEVNHHASAVLLGVAGNDEADTGIVDGTADGGAHGFFRGVLGERDLDFRK